MKISAEYKNQLSKVLIELEAHSELIYGMIDYFKRCFDRDKELNVEMVLQAFKVIWDNFESTLNKNYVIINDFMKLKEQ